MLNFLTNTFAINCLASSKSIILTTFLQFFCANYFTNVVSRTHHQFMQPVSMNSRSINVKTASVKSHLLIIRIQSITHQRAQSRFDGQKFIVLKMKQIKVPLQSNKIVIKHNHTLMQTTQHA